MYAKDILQVGPAGLGLLSTAPAVGAAVAGLAIARRRAGWPVPRRGGRLRSDDLVFGASFSAARFGVALDARLFLGAVGGFGDDRRLRAVHVTPLSLVALALLGGLDSISVVIRQTVIQQATPDALRGRVGAVNRVFISSSNELGARNRPPRRPSRAGGGGGRRRPRHPAGGRGEPRVFPSSNCCAAAPDPTAFSDLAQTSRPGRILVT
jgi:hypothetical protein